MDVLIAGHKINSYILMPLATLSSIGDSTLFEEVGGAVHFMDLAPRWREPRSESEHGRRGNLVGRLPMRIWRDERMHQTDVHVFRDEILCEVLQVHL